MPNGPTFAASPAVRPSANVGMALALVAGLFGSLDTALNVAFPDLIDDFDREVGDLQWVIVSYVVSYGALLLGAGGLGDRFGHRRLAAVGALGSTLAIFACAVAPSFGWFLVARVGQGTGTALVMASAPALAALSAPPSSKGRALGRFQTSAAIGLTVGPILGGVLVELGGWRGVFWFRVPIGMLLLAMAARAVQAPGTPSRADVALEPVQASVAGSTVRFITDNLASIGANGAAFALWLFLPSLLIDHRNLGAGAAGLVLAVSPAATAVAALGAGRLADRGRTTSLLLGGLTLEAAGLAMLSQATATTGMLALASGTALTGAGLGLFTVPNMARVMAAAGERRQGIGGALCLLTRTVGIVGAALGLTAVFDASRPGVDFFDRFEVVFVLATGIVLVIVVLTGAVDRRQRLPSPS